MSKTRTKEHYGFAKLMFSGDGLEGAILNITPGIQSCGTPPKNVPLVDLRCVLCSLFCGAFV